LGRDSARGRLLPRYGPLLTSEAKVLAYHEGAHGTAMISEEPGGKRSLFLDGFRSTSNHAGTEYMAMMAHLPLLARPAAKNVLVICLGTGMTAGAAALHDLERLDVVELNPDVKGFTRYFDAENHRLLDDPRVHVVIDDGRNYLHRSPRSYDVITLEPLPPWFAGTVSLYTQEFNALAKERLVRGGVLAQWLPYHLVSDYKARMIVAAMREVFPYVGVWVDPMNYSGIALASDQPLAFDLAAAPPKASADLKRLGYAPQEVFDDYWALSPDFAQAYAGSVPPVTDDHPYLEYPDARDDEPGKDDEERFDRRVASLFKAGGKDVNAVLRRIAARLQPKLVQGQELP
jgi:spermidine synthase